MGAPPVAPAFERALAAEVVASEQMRVRTLAATLTVLLVAVELMFIVFNDDVQRLARRPIPVWLPLAVLGPFTLYEIGVSLGLGRFRRRAMPVPTVLRFVNATIETTLPSVLLWTLARHW